MAERPLPSWKQLYDAVEKRVGPRIDEIARSQEMAALAALNKRGQTEFARRLEQVSRRTLHVWNLPAGSDVNRLLTHIAQLEREVRDLRKEVTDRNDAEFLASLATRRPTLATSQIALPKVRRSPGKAIAAKPSKAKPSTGKPSTAKPPATKARAATAKKPAAKNATPRIRPDETRGA